MPATLAGIVLGRLERQTLDVIWEWGECSVREVARRLTRKRAYTTVMTTLDRLYQKGILNRKTVGGRFLYSARLSRQELEKFMAQDLIAGVLASSTTSRELIVLSLLEAIRRQDSRLFYEKVATMTRAKRRRSG
jgi:predicted transcriptional regulator